MTKGDHSGRRWNAVLFDLGGTLIDYSGGKDKWPALEAPGFTAAHRFLGNNGLRLPGLRRFVESGFDLLPKLWKEATGGTKNLTVFNLLADLLHQLSVQEGDADLLQEAATLYHSAVRALARPIPQAKEVLRILKAEGYQLGLVSNTMFPGHAHLEDMGRFGLGRYFQETVFSADENMWKPSVKPFQHVLDALGTDPGEAVFVGDDPSTDVAGAQAAGVLAIYFASSQRFQNQGGPVPSAKIDRLAELPELLSRL